MKGGERPYTRPLSQIPGYATATTCRVNLPVAPQANYSPTELSVCLSVRFILQWVWLEINK